MNVGYIFNRLDIYCIFCVFQQYSKEILADDISDVQYDKIKNIVEKASGAAYGTGQRYVVFTFLGKRQLIPWSVFFTESTF